MQRSFAAAASGVRIRRVMRCSTSDSGFGGRLAAMERIAVGIGPLTEAEVIERFVGRSDGHMKRELEARCNRLASGSRK